MHVVLQVIQRIIGEVPSISLCTYSFYLLEYNIVIVIAQMRTHTNAIATEILIPVAIEIPFDIPSEALVNGFHEEDVTATGGTRVAEGRRLYQYIPSPINIPTAITHAMIIAMIVSIPAEEDQKEGGGASVVSVFSSSSSEVGFPFSSR